MDLSTLQQLNAARDARRAVALVTDLGDGRGMAITEGETMPEALAASVATAFLTGKAVTADIDGRSVFINAYLPPPRIVVIGAVHISQALAQLAPVTGYDLTIIDPRTAFATPERFAGVDLIAEWPEDALRARPLDSYTAVAAVTHDPKIDDFALSAALSAGCFYVGALGSRKTHAKRVERLVALGHSQAEIARISAPIGLDIGAASPAEIALATLGDIVRAFRRRSLASGQGDA
ncbi:MAG: XdhC family protein [Neorhizobium sp.]|nr:XdhC family protein [Neorhizobium sp.]